MHSVETPEGNRLTMVRNFFGRKKTIQEVITSGQEVRRNLEWALGSQVEVRLSAGSFPRSVHAKVSGVDHSPLNAYILLRAEIPQEVKSILNGKGSLTLEYDSRRGTRFHFQSFLLSEMDMASGEFRAGYPSEIETVQDIHAYRFKNILREPIQVDLGKERGVAVDIGLHGLLITCNRIFEKEEFISDLKIALPELSLVQGTAVVRHIQNSKAYPGWRYLCGVEITGMKPKDHRNLNRYLTRMLSQ